MDQKKKFSLSAWILLFLTLSTDPFFGLDDSSKVFLGFAENGSWREKGAIYLQVNSAEYTDDLLSEKQKNELRDKQYLEIPFNQVKGISGLTPEQRFDVYSKNGSLGTFKISRFVILANACAGNLYLYAKLDKKSDSSWEPPFSVVAKMEEKEPKNKIVKVYKNQNLQGKEKARIEKILFKKLKYAREKVLGPEFILLEQKAKKQFQFDLEYKAFKISDFKEKKTQWVINAIWNCKDVQLQSQTGYYLTNIFTVSGDKITEWDPLEYSKDEYLDIKRIEFGIDLETNHRVQWLIEHEQWERGSSDLYEWENDQKSTIIYGNGYGC